MRNASAKGPPNTTVYRQKTNKSGRSFQESGRNLFGTMIHKKTYSESNTQDNFEEDKLL